MPGFCLFAVLRQIPFPWGSSPDPSAFCFLLLSLLPGGQCLEYGEEGHLVSQRFVFEFQSYLCEAEHIASASTVRIYSK